MTPRVFHYIFRIWIGSVLLGPILLIFSAVGFSYLVQVTRSSSESSVPRHPLDWPDWSVVFDIFIASTLVLIPIFLLLWLGCFFLCRRAWSLRVRKFALSFSALLLISATAIILLTINQTLVLQTIVIAIASFYLPAMAGIYLNRFPERRVDPVFDF